MHQPPASIDRSFAAETNVADWYARGEALANMNRHSEALTCFDQLLELQPDHHKAWTFRGVVLIHLGRNHEALASCDRALALHPQDPEAWMFRGVALYRLSQYQAAYASYDKALGIQRTGSLWRSWLSWLKSRF
jgi:tetratricopeptide (TPR) repeat protein